MDIEKGILNNPLQELELNDKNFDITFTYLRQVHAYCYFCSLEALDERMLVSKCKLSIFNSGGYFHLKIVQNEIPSDFVIDIPNWQTKCQQECDLMIKELKIENQ